MGSTESVNRAILPVMSMLNVENRKKNNNDWSMSSKLFATNVLHTQNKNLYLWDIHTHATRANLYTFRVVKCFGKENVT